MMMEGSRTLYLADMDPLWDEAYVLALFGGYGMNGLQQVKIIRDKVTGMAMGYGFLEFDTFESAKRVLEIYQGREIPGYPGKVLRLNWGERKGTTIVAEHSLFVGDLASTVTDQTLMETFKSRFPSCVNARVVTDHNTGSSLGYGFVRFNNEEELRMAVDTMTGHILAGRTIRVARAQDRRNMMKPPGTPLSTPAMSAPMQAFPQSYMPASVPGDENNVTVFVGNLDPNVTEDLLTNSFSQFGQVMHTRIPAGKHIGFVTMATHEQATAALNGMNGVQISTRPLRCAWGNKAAKPMGSMGGCVGVSAGMGGGVGPGYFPADPYYPQYDPYAMAQWQMWSAASPYGGAGYPNVTGHGAGSDDSTAATGSAVSVNGANVVNDSVSAAVTQPAGPLPVPDFSRGYEVQQANGLYHRHRLAPAYDHPATRSPVSTPFALG